MYFLLVLQYAYLRARAVLEVTVLVLGNEELVAVLVLGIIITIVINVVIISIVKKIIVINR